MGTSKPRGRPSRHRLFDDLLEEARAKASKRPQYRDGIGIHVGCTKETAYLKIYLRRGGCWRGRTKPAGSSIEINLGRLSSWKWDELIKQRDELQGRADRGEPLEEMPSESFRSLAERWFQNKAPNLKGRDTVRSHLHKTLLPRFGDLPLAEITTKAINDWQAERLQERKPGTVKREKATLSSILGTAVKEDLLTTNPVSKTENIRGVEARRRWLTRDELTQLIETASRLDGTVVNLRNAKLDAWRADFIRWAILTGMRRQEILNLKRKHLSFEGGELISVSVENTKSGQTRSLSGRGALGAIVSRRMSRIDVPAETPVFDVSLTTLKRGLTELFEASGLKDVRLHDLRRTHATYLIGDGVDLRTVASRLGHSNFSMLERHYAQWMSDDSASESINRTFANLIK